MTCLGKVAVMVWSLVHSYVLVACQLGDCMEHSVLLAMGIAMDVCYDIIWSDLIAHIIRLPILGTSTMTVTTHGSEQLTLSISTIM